VEDTRIEGEKGQDVSQAEGRSEADWQRFLVFVCSFARESVRPKNGVSFSQLRK